jgi:2-keto-4-pentenoate hydratase/2-oxohepta-3-ene-1,7-dioic acid hydratase in catechol pathway
VDFSSLEIRKFQLSYRPRLPIAARKVFMDKHKHRYPTIASEVLTELNTAALKPLAGEVRYLAPIHGIQQIPATGFNYKKHIEEMKVPSPAEPEVFLKSTLSLTGPFDPIQRGPNAGVKLDWETELARHRP